MKYADQGDPGPQGQDAAPALERIRIPPVKSPSTPVVGGLQRSIHNQLRRLVDTPLRDVASQVEAALQHHAAALRAETAERERAQQDIQTIARRLDRLENTLNALQLAPRLARLERTRISTSEPNRSRDPQSGAPGAAPSASGFDYLAFEARFRGDERTIKERQHVYLELLSDRSRVLDVGCGRGELLELLRDAGISAYGVEVEPDFVDLLREKGLEVAAEDLEHHLRSIEPGVVDAIVASHVVEHLPTDALVRFVQLAQDRLASDGVLVMETPNPESLVAGSINFYRDPTHIRQVHPDTLAFIAESAGFANVEILRLSPVPTELRLPVCDPGLQPLADHVNDLTTRLNELLFGFQDYAVIARRSGGPHVDG